MFAALADGATVRGDTTEALSLALRGLPKALADLSNWPDTPEAAVALFRAAQEHYFEKFILSGPRCPIGSVAFSPDGTRLASADTCDYTSRLRDSLFSL